MTTRKELVLIGLVRKSFFLILLLISVMVGGDALAQGLPSPPPGPAPTVTATETQAMTPQFTAGTDAPAPRPNHPPISEIPPMPMPNDRPGILNLPASEGPGQGVIHDLRTGETILVPAEPGPALEGFQRGGGYAGADGGGGTENWAASFSPMIHMTNTQDFPWRMNVKVVMRFGTAWFVCSGTMRDAGVVLTAGHCVYDHGNSSWADEIWVYPGWDGVAEPPSVVNPYGYGHAADLMGAWTGWIEDGNWDNDVGYVGFGRAVGMLTGWFAWVHGGSCDWHKATGYHNASYPQQACGIPGLHNGRDMYYWSGYFDDCPDNQLQLNTTPGCFTAVWGGMSGSGAYFIEGDTRYVHAVCSTSNRSTEAKYCRQWDDWVNFGENDFIPSVRGSNFDLQPLDQNVQPETIRQGESTTLLNHLATNPTNGYASDTYIYRVYLSSNDNINTSDTLLSVQSYDWYFAPVSSVRVNMGMVTIPYGTPPGDYWIGVIYDSATDGNSSNNNMAGWDAARIHVDAETTPPTPNPMTWYWEPYETSTSSISMEATMASDPTPPVSYYFEFYGSPTGGGGGTSSAWQNSTFYTDSGLSANHQYGYRVKARDGRNNETAFSAVSYDYTDIQASSGITFGTVTSTSIQARSYNTPTGLTRGSSGLLVENVTNATNSGWKQNNNYWVSSPLSPNTQYGFRARTRNGDANEASPSGILYRYTLANAPGVGGFTNITQTSIQANWTANGNPAGTLYYCENMTKGTNSGWTANTSWNSTGLSCGISYTFRVKARNGAGTQTALVSLGTQSTSRCEGLPDLVETSVSNPPPTALRGKYFAVTDTVKNQGSNKAGASATRYYLSLDTAKGTGDILLTGYRSVAALVAGATSTGKVNVTVPTTAALGTYYLLACADEREVVAESNEANNCIASGTQVQVTLPDLIETSVSNPPEKVVLGGRMSVTDAAKNQGLVGTGRTSITRYYLSKDAGRDPTDKLLTGYRTVPALAAGATSTGTVTVTVPTTTVPDKYYLLACADDTRAVAETSETNNCASSRTWVAIVAP
jgi:hypothetical protein